jgi:hypothetical protein
MKDSEGIFRCHHAEDIVDHVEPSQGSCLIFNHAMLHEGQQLELGSADKYILRSDIMFVRDENTAPGLTAAQLEAVEHLKLATALEEQGNMQAAMREYQQVERKDAGLLR